MAGDILVVVEHQGGAPKRPSLEALTAGARLASALQRQAMAVVTGTGAAGTAALLGRHGAARVLTLAAEPRDRQAWAAAVAGLLAAEQPAAVLAAHTAAGKDLMPRVAGLADLPLASDCLALSVDGGALVARRPVFAGKALVTVSAGAGSCLLATLRPNAVPAAEAPAAGALSQAATSAPTQGLGALLKDVVAAASAKLELSEASIVVSGGRGMKGPENWGLIEELAAALGAATGASRAVCDAGWRPHSEQVGQTGKTVSPQLYLAVGISGAIQHLAGMRTSHYIVAINRDAEAPIFKVADYGIVGDALEVLPRLTAAVKALLAKG